MTEDSTSLITRPDAPEAVTNSNPGILRVLAGAAIVVVSWQILFYLISPLIQAFGYQSAAAISYTLLAFRFIIVLGGFYLAAKKKILTLPAGILVLLGLVLANLAALPGFPFSYVSTYGAIGLAGPVAVYASFTALHFASWLVLRGRPARSYLVLIPVAVIIGLIALLGNLSSSRITWTLPPYAGPLVALTCIGGAWLAALVDPRRNEVPAKVERAPRAYATNPTVTTPGPTNGMAIASLIVVFFNSVVGLILGHVALSQIKRSGQAGRGLALAAVIIGWIATGLAVITVVVYLIILGTTASHYR